MCRGPCRFSPYVSLLGARHLLTLPVTGQTRSAMQETVHTIFAEGDTNGKLLAMLVADYHPIANIPVIRDVGALVTDPLLIMQEFVLFFSSLYSPISAYDESAFNRIE